MKEEVKALWKQCFSDSDEFIDLYFDMRYKEEINRAIVKDGRVISALQAIPYPMTCYARTIEMVYISGACTHPDFRAHGVMRQLLKETHRRMYEDGIYLSTLIPAEDWLRGYYAKSGYTTCFYYEQTSVSSSALKTFDSACEVERCEYAEREVYDYFQSRMQQRPNCVQHTWDDYKVILADLHLGGGLVLVARLKGQIIGLAFCVKENTLSLVKEMLYDTPVGRDALFRKIFSLYGVDKLEYVHAADTSALPLGMARIISVKEMLSLYAETHPSARLYCHVDGDDAIPENNGYYALEQGQCILGKQSGKEYVPYTIESLTQKLFETEWPYMSLMLN